jgi:adenylate cyclase
MQRGEEITLGGEKREITIFCSDIAGFTTISEAYPTEILTPLLAEYFDALSKIILEAEGTIDKYIGDSIMAFWNAPTEMPDHAMKACLVALRCQALLHKLNQQRKENNQPEFQTRFGINTGMVIVGNVGTTERMNYTVIGDAVNIAFRLQNTSKNYNTHILISEDVYKKVNHQFVVRPLDIVTVKGKKEEIKIYELVALREGEAEILAKPEEIQLCEAFTEAYEAFQQKNIERAKPLFEAIHAQFPDDLPTKLYLDRIREMPL